MRGNDKVKRTETNRLEKQSWGKHSRFFIPRFCLVTACALAIAFILASCDQKPQKKQANATKLVVAVSKYIGSAPVFVAQKQGYFRDEGLDVELIVNDAGVQDFRNLLDGDAQIAMVAELPLVYAAFDKLKATGQDSADFVIFADMVLASKISKILVRKDSGIESPQDVRGKTVAVPMGTSIDFLLDLFLMTHSIDRSELIIRDMDVISQVEGIVAGEVDAIFAWQPHVGEAARRLGSEGLILPLDLFYHNAWLAVAMKAFAAEHPGIVEGFLRAVVRAEEFMRKRPAESIAIHAEYSGMPMEVISQVWDEITFWISLSEGLLTTMDDQARWIIRHRQADGRARDEIPDFQKYLLLDPMIAVKPQGLTLIK